MWSELLTASVNKAQTITAATQKSHGMCMASGTDVRKDEQGCVAGDRGKPRARRQMVRQSIYSGEARAEPQQNGDGQRWIVLTNYIRNFRIVMCHVIQMGT